jgi:hypothetical protein
MFRSVGWPLLRAEGFFCNLDILYGGLGILNCSFLIKKKFNFFFSCNFFLFLVIKALDPDWIRIGLQPQMLDPDPDQMNADPKPWLKSSPLNGTSCVLNGTSCVLNGTSCLLNGTSGLLNGTSCLLNGTSGLLNGTSCVLNGKSSVLNCTSAC